MKALKTLLKFARNRSGATAIEYALIAGIICIAVVGGVTAAGSTTNETFENLSDEVWGDA